MIFWSDTISIISVMFEIKEKDIAGLLGVSPGTLSKVKNGMQDAPTKFVSTAIYRKIFDPATNGSPAFGKKTESLFSDLKLTIETSFPKVQESLADCWEEKEYPKFVMMLLSRTRRSLPPPKTDNAEPVTRPNNTKTQSEKLQELFLMAVREYNIMDTINRKSARLYLTDSADLNNFWKLVDKLLLSYDMCDLLLKEPIKLFKNDLQHWALILDAGLSNKYGSNLDETSYIDMDDADSVEVDEIKNRLALPELSLDLIEDSDNKLHVMELYNDTWAKFRTRMNRRYEQIKTCYSESTKT